MFLFLGLAIVSATFIYLVIFGIRSHYEAERCYKNHDNWVKRSVDAGQWWCVCRDCKRLETHSKLLDRGIKVGH